MSRSVVRSVLPDGRIVLDFGGPMNFASLRRSVVRPVWHPKEGEKSRTRQSEAKDADINTIVKRFGVTGTVPVPTGRVPQYGDFPETFDMMTAMNSIRRTQEAFDALPATVRDRFHNDPVEYYNFVVERDESGKQVNFDEMVKLGLVKKRKPVVPSEPQRVVVVSENGDGKVDSGKGATGGSASSGKA